uniref:Uncharacterized protein n=1 Tax=Hyaloperonospora arabidopsidis (strain Emoy2) TaxID=559515 RepID=M4BLF9_HYAAE
MHRCSIASIASRLAGERDVNEGRDGDNTKIHLTWNNVRFYKKLIYKSRATAPSVTEPSSPVFEDKSSQWKVLFMCVSEKVRYI